MGFGLLKDIGGDNAWINHLLQLFAFFMLTGIFSSLLIPETKGKTLEELAGETESVAPLPEDTKIEEAHQQRY